MNLRDFGLVTDENIESDIFAFLQSEGFNVIKSVDLTRPGADDNDILKIAHKQNRVVLTHDRDFGALAVAAKQAFTGILFLRPGHILSAFTIESLRTLLQRGVDLTPPFIIVVERTGNDVHIRIRQPII